jgi:hypothetical protein
MQVVAKALFKAHVEGQLKVFIAITDSLFWHVFSFIDNFLMIFYHTIHRMKL